MTERCLEALTRHPINWQRIGRAISFYENAGFTNIETPWRVHDDFVRATKPPSATPFRCALADLNRPNVLVGSAEQGLLSIMSTLALGCYQSTSPCFRDNEVDDIHFSDFIKVELCCVLPTGQDKPRYGEWAANKLGEAAKRFAASEGCTAERIETEIGFDLIFNGIEIGSYGWRSVVIDDNEYEWAYGTGLAEPRFSQALRGIYK